MEELLVRSYVMAVPQLSLSEIAEQYIWAGIGDPEMCSPELPLSRWNRESGTLRQRSQLPGEEPRSRGAEVGFEPWTSEPGEQPLRFGVATNLKGNLP